MISLGWGNADDSLLVWRMENHWNYDAFLQVLEKSNHLVASRNYAVDILIDMQASVHAPNNILDVIITGFGSLPYNVRSVVVIGGSTACANLYNTVKNTHNFPKTDVHFVQDANVAYDIIYTRKDYAS